MCPGCLLRKLGSGGGRDTCSLWPRLRRQGRVLQHLIQERSSSWSCKLCMCAGIWFHRDSEPGGNNGDVKWHRDNAVCTFRTPPLWAHLARPKSWSPQEALCLVIERSFGSIPNFGFAASVPSDMWGPQEQLCTVTACMVVPGLVPHGLVNVAAGLLCVPWDTFVRWLVPEGGYKFRSA